MDCQKVDASENRCPTVITSFSVHNSTSKLSEGAKQTSSLVIDLTSSASPSSDSFAASFPSPLAQDPLNMEVEWRNSLIDNFQGSIERIKKNLEDDSDSLQEVFCVCENDQSETDHIRCNEFETPVYNARVLINVCECSQDSEQENLLPSSPLGESFHDCTSPSPPFQLAQDLEDTDVEWYNSLMDNRRNDISRWKDLVDESIDITFLGEGDS